MAQGVTTEWEDIHVAKGNQEERPYESSLAEEEEVVKDKFQSDVIEHKNEVQQALEDLDLDLDLDLEDDEVMKEWKQSRMNQIRDETVNKNRFSGVLQVHYGDQVSEVTNASEDCLVVLNLQHDSVEKSILINRCFDELSQKQSNIKFCKGIATKIIENFDLRALPTIIIYKNKKILKYETGLLDELYGGLRTSSTLLEQLFRKIWGIEEFNQSRFEFDDEYDPREEILKTTIAFRGKSQTNNTNSEKLKDVYNQKTQAFND